MKNFARVFSITTVVYLFILTISAIVELFMMPHHSDVRITLMGIKIDNKFTTHNIATTFSPTWHLFISYSIFLLVGFIINWFIFKMKKDK